MTTPGGGTPPPGMFLRTAGDLRAWTRKRTFEALDRLLDDCSHYVELHAEVTGQDHLGNVAVRMEALRQFEEGRARMRTAHPERMRRVQRWARDVTREAAARQARLPRPAGPVDFARALSSATERASVLLAAGEHLPATADLIAQLADPIVYGPAVAEEEAPAIGIIGLPASDDELARYGDDKDDSKEPNTDAERQSAPTLPPAGAREAVAAQVLALLAVCVHQIGRVLVLVDTVERPDATSHALSGMLLPSDLDPTVLLDIAVEVARLRAAQRARAHARVQQVMEQAGILEPKEPDEP